MIMRYDENTIFIPLDTTTGPVTRAALVRELVDNGRATLQENESELALPNLEAVKLSMNERSILQLPGPYPYTVQLEASGSFADPDFRVTPRYYNFPEGMLLPGKRTGAVLRVREATYLLSKEQYDAVTYSQEVKGDRGSQASMVSVARLKGALRKTSVILDNWLESEEIHLPEQVSLTVKRGAGGVFITPEVKAVPGFSNRFRQLPSVQSTYAVDRDDGGRTRVVVTPKQQSQLAKIKRLGSRPLSDEETLQLVENAPTWLDDNVFDLDEFSQRVLEIGIYRPRFYPFISPYQTEWFPGFISESPEGKRIKVRIETEEELTKLEGELQEAIDLKRPTVAYAGHDIPISDVQRIVKNAKRQLADKSKPLPSTDKNVLIIKENVEEFEFAEVPEVSAESHDFIYEPIDSMRESFSPKAHQVDAIAWLQTLCASKSGVLLADDMGLGKTLTVLTFLRWADAREPFVDHPHLVVAPLSLLENWDREYTKFFLPSRPHIERLQGRATKDQLRALKPGVIYLTTYETVRKHQLDFGRVDWGVVALDEVQRIKTPGTLITNAAKALKAEFRIGITGTPVENTLVDLWCIVDFLVPGFLGSAREFVNKYEKRQKNGDDALADIGASLRNKLGVLLKRRLKGDVLSELPKKFEHRIEEPMTTIQAARYKSILNHVSRLKEYGNSSPGEILSALTRLRLVADHPILVGEESRASADAEILFQSGKMVSLRQILRQVASKKEKVIVFAELKRSQRMIALMIEKEFGFLPRIVNGDMPANASAATISRQEAIDEFEDNQGFSAIVMSPIAAGVGLNVTAANHVVHYSRHWNPAKEQQATDRAYRIGQEKDVHVYYLLGTLDGVRTFDQLLDDLLSKKKALSEATLFPSERLEVKSAELLEALSELAEPSRSEHPLALEDVLRLSQAGQKAALATLMENAGYDIQLLDEDQGHGADLLATSGGILLVVGLVRQSGLDLLKEATAWTRRMYPYYDVSPYPVIINESKNGKQSLSALLREYPITESDIQRFYPIGEEESA